MLTSAPWRCLKWLGAKLKAFVLRHRLHGGDRTTVIDRQITEIRVEREIARDERDDDEARLRKARLRAEEALRRARG